MFRSLYRAAALFALAAAVVPVAAQVSPNESGETEVRAKPAVLAEMDLGSGVVLRVLGLERLGSRAVKATLEVENASKEQVSLEELGIMQSINSGWGGDLGHHALIDFQNGKKYKVIRDGEGNCLCFRDTRATSVKDIEAGRSRQLWVQFTPPPLEVTTVSLEIPGLTMFDELPIAP